VIDSAIANFQDCRLPMRFATEHTVAEVQEFVHRLFLVADMASY
jgi:hypothetical protein